MKSNNDIRLCVCSMPVAVHAIHLAKCAYILCMSLWVISLCREMPESDVVIDGMCVCVCVCVCV